MPASEIQAERLLRRALSADNGVWGRFASLMFCCITRELLPIRGANDSEINCIEKMQSRVKSMLNQISIDRQSATTFS